MSRSGGALVSLVLIAIATAFFMYRYQPAFQIPNFYAEDGNIFVNTALHKNFFMTILTGFNGYLVVGQYMLVELAIAVHHILGLPFYDLPVVLAVISCAFFGVTAALPFMLLRKQLGLFSTFFMWAAVCLVALPSYDYAVLGTIGNLKFLFLVWTFFFILYRNAHSMDIKRTSVADVFIILSVLTYAPAVALLPFALWPYRTQLLEFYKLRKLKRLSRGLWALILLGAVCFIYLVIVYIKDIPEIPGYLDSPYIAAATIKILYRVTFYEFLLPLTASMRDLLVLGLVGITAYLGLRSRATRFLTVFTFWSVAIATIAFVMNRPGVSYAFEVYGPTPDQFFYAQALLFTFMCICIISAYASRLSLSGKGVLIVVALLFVWWKVPYIDSNGYNKVAYERLGTSKSNLTAACRGQKGELIDFQIYPVEPWRWQLDRDIACKGVNSEE